MDPCHRQWAALPARALADGRPRVHAVLDVCCGTGLLAAELVDARLPGRGVDASAQCSSRARDCSGRTSSLDGRRFRIFTVDAVVRRSGLHLRRPQLPGRRGVRETLAVAGAPVASSGWFVFDVHTDAMMEFTVANPVVEAWPMGSRFAITSVWTSTTRVCESQIDVVRRATATPSPSATCSLLHRPADAGSAHRRRLRGARGDRRVHVRAGRHIEPAGDLDRAASPS